MLINFSLCVCKDDQRVQSLSVSEDLKMKETQLEDSKKQLINWESKLRQQQQLYEAVRSDRNHYSKGEKKII